jgi:phosphatidylglycerophosphate synthase
MSDGRKIKSEFENPIDNLFIKISEVISGPLVKIGITPNMITTLSFIFGLIAVYLLYKDHYLLAGCSFVLGYFFDCMDGYVARKYNMISKFGDLYDHVTDVITNVILLVVFMCKKINIKLKIFLFILIFVFLFFSLTHLGCQEKYYEIIQKKNSTDGILYNFVKLCKKKEMIRTTRFFGTGTYTILIFIIIVFHKKINNFFISK